MERLTDGRLTDEEIAQVVASPLTYSVERVLALEVQEARQALATASVLIDHLIDGWPCSFDHHGYCQAHHGGFMDGGCWETQAIVWLAANNVTA